MYQFSGGQEVTAEAEGLTADLGAPAISDVPAQLHDPGGNWVTFAVIAEGILYRTDKIKTPHAAIRTSSTRATTATSPSRPSPTATAPTSW